MKKGRKEQRHRARLLGLDFVESDDADILRKNPIPRTEVGVGRQGCSREGEEGGVRGGGVCLVDHWGQHLWMSSKAKRVIALLRAPAGGWTWEGQNTSQGSHDPEKKTQHRTQFEATSQDPTRTRRDPSCSFARMPLSSPFYVF